MLFFFFFFQAEDGIRDHCVTGVQTCALPILDPEGVNSNAALTVPPFTNHGLIVLDNRLPSNVLESRLTVTGTLLNDTDGSIESRNTQLYGGSRFLRSEEHTPEIKTHSDPLSRHQLEKKKTMSGGTITVA